MAGLAHEKVGHTEQGLWHHKGWQLPAYIQHVANDLISSGHSESRAIEMAVGIVRNWAHGHDGHGHAIHPDTAAKAAAAIAEWDALKAKAAASKASSSRRAGMADTRAPYGNVEYADPGYLDADGNPVSKSGNKGVQRYPIDAEHVQAAWAYINKEKNAGQYTAEQLSAIKGRIKAAMKRHGHDVSDDTASQGASRSDTAYTRSFGLEDISIRAGDGRTVDAYAAVFDLSQPIRDQDGEYNEIIDRSAFNGALANAAPSGGRERWRVGVFYNHGRTIWNTPSDLYSMPVGVPLEIRADGKGLFTRTKYLPGPLGDSILDAIREGSITGYSFSGAFTRSDPDPRRAGRMRADRAGSLPTVRRMESTLREYGPTPFPAYADASIVGMRAEQAAMLLSTMPADEFDRFRAMFVAVAAVSDLPDTGGVTEAEPPKPAARSLKEQLDAEWREFMLRHRKD